MKGTFDSTALGMGTDVASAGAFAIGSAPLAEETRSEAAPRSVLSLNGTWELAFDPDNLGQLRGWERAFPPGAIAVPVPSVWERVRPGYDGVGWYRRKFHLPRGWERKMLRLRFHAAQYFAEAWLNGQPIGHHEGGFLPFEFPVSNWIRPGENELVVRVINPPMDREIDGFRCGAPLNQSTIPVGKAGWYYNFGGLWQTVELQATERLAITQVALEPWPSRARLIVRLEIELEGPAGMYELNCAIRGCGEAAPAPPVRRRRWRLHPGRNRLRWPLSFPEARRWSLTDPFLYHAELTVTTGDKVCDQAKTRFGMREFTVRGGRFLLNGEPVVLKGFLHQGSYPRTLVGPEDRAFAERELRLVKENGFNFVRAHLMPALPLWLDVADELGLLIMAEPPIGWIEQSPHAEKRCWREIEGLVARDNCHASIVLWCLMNEVFHLKGFTPQDVRRMTVRWLERLRRLDPTRPVIDVSGGHGLIEVGGAADMLPDTTRQRLTACLSMSGELKFRAVLDAHIYHGYPLRDEIWRRMRHLGGGSDLFFVSEYGAPPIPPHFAEVLDGYTRSERALGLEDWQLHEDFAASLRGHWENSPLGQAFGEPEVWIETCNQRRADEMRLVTTALRSNPKLAGYCFCQLADASGELFGALDFWRRPKPMLAALAEASAPSTVGVFAWPRVAGPGDAVKVELAWLDDNVRASEGELTVELRDAAGERIRSWQKQYRRRRQGSRRIWQATATMPKQPGVYTLCATGNDGGQGALHGRLELRVVPAAARSKKSVAFGDVSHRLEAGLRRQIATRLPYGNNYREVESPVFLDLAGPPADRVAQAELFGQLRKVLQVGGCAVLFEPEMGLLHDQLLSGSVRKQPLMHPMPYALAHPILDGLPQDVVTDYCYASVQPEKYDSVDDIQALGGNVIFGALAIHIWTRPAVFFHGAALYTLPVGRGTLVVCHLKLLDKLGSDPVARLLLANLVRFAHASIRLSDRSGLLSRCIDPLQPTS